MAARLGIVGAAFSIAILAGCAADVAPTPEPAPVAPVAGRPDVAPPEVKTGVTTNACSWTGYWTWNATTRQWFWTWVYSCGTGSSTAS